MATGYSLSIGYMSGYSYNGDKDEAWILLKAAVDKLIHHPERIEVESVRFSVEKASSEIYEVARTYKLDPVNGGPLSIHENDTCICVLCSGSGNGRKIKELVARAFCRLIVHDMNLLGIEICVNVS